MDPKGKALSLDRSSRSHIPPLYHTLTPPPSTQQRDVRSAVYGTAAPGETVTATLSASASASTVLPAASATAYSATAAADGTFKVLLAAHAADGKSYTLTASSATKSITLTDVVFGDVWLCSGQSNMELAMTYTLSRNASYDAIRAGKYTNVRLLHFDHNPQPAPVYVTSPGKATGLIVANWSTPAQALVAPGEAMLDAFSATCFYFGQALTDRMVASKEVVPVGLIESAYGGTMIESWLSAEAQLTGCTNITCTSKQPMPFTRDTEQACLAAGVGGGTSGLGAVAGVDVGATAEVGTDAQGAGANGELYNGMIGPFVNMTIKGWLW